MTCIVLLYLLGILQQQIRSGRQINTTNHSSFELAGSLQTAVSSGCNLLQRIMLAPVEVSSQTSFPRQEILMVCVRADKQPRQRVSRKCDNKNDNSRTVICFFHTQRGNKIKCIHIWEHAAPHNNSVQSQRPARAPKQSSCTPPRPCGQSHFPALYATLGHRDGRLSPAYVCVRYSCSTVYVPPAGTALYRTAVARCRLQPS